MPKARFRVRFKQKFRFVPKHKYEAKNLLVNVTYRIPAGKIKGKAHKVLEIKKHKGKFEQGASQKGAFTPSFQSAGAAYSRRLREEQMSGK